MVTHRDEVRRTRWTARGARLRRRGIAFLATLLVLVLLGAATFVVTHRGTNEPALRRGLFLDPDRPPAALAAQLARYRQLKVNSVTIAADLAFLCPNERCDFGILATAIEASHQAGMSIVLQVNRVPESLDARGPAYGPDTPGKRQAWVSLFRQLVQRFRTSVSYYELWNEPDTDQFWKPGPDPSAYAALLHDAYLAAKGVDRHVTIVGGNFAANDIGYLQRLYDAIDTAYGRETARRQHYYFDVLGIHPYTGENGSAYAPDDATSRIQHTDLGDVDRSFLGFRRLRDVMTQREHRTKPLAFGEFGYRTDAGAHGPVPDDVRARWLTDAFHLAAADGGVRYLTWYVYDTNEPDQQGFAIRGTKTEDALANLR